jgi:enoyl-CoA hydratase/carnithine racemase
MPVGRDRRGAVQVLVLDRQEALNAFSPELIDELIGALDDAAADPGVRAVVLTGAGRAFSAGADISRMAQMDVDAARVFAAPGHAMCRARSTASASARATATSPRSSPTCS